MGSASDSETENIIIEPEINGMNLQANDIDTDDSNDNYNADNKNNIKHSSKKNLSFLYKCTYADCEKFFEKPSRLTWHLHQHTGERPYECDFKNCGKSYTNPSHLKRHLKSHDPVYKAAVSLILYQCDVCQLTLKNQFNLKRHYQRAHENENLSCKKCNLSFRKKNTYNEHLASFHNGELFKCNQCSREFKNTAKLRKHEKSHNIKYKCLQDDCNAVFDTYNELRRHSTTHPKEYECDVCKKILFNTYQFKRHLKTHEDKLLACPYNGCDNKYHHANQLDGHIRTKHEQTQLFECDLCKRIFTYKSVLDKHIKSIHLYKISKVFKKGNKIKFKSRPDKKRQNIPLASTGVSLPKRAKKNNKS